MKILKNIDLDKLKDQMNKLKGVDFCREHGEIAIDKISKQRVLTEHGKEGIFRFGVNWCVYYKESSIKKPKKSD
jgi:hypothetical protein